MGGEYIGWTGVNHSLCCTYGAIAEVCAMYNQAVPTIAPADEPQPATYLTCSNDSTPVDRDGDGCDKYLLNPGWCGGRYDTADFKDN